MEITQQPPAFIAKGFPNPKYTLLRMDSSKGRQYYRFLEDGTPKFYSGVTSFIKAVLPTSPQLLQWLVSKGSDAKEETNEAADYGTFMHIQAQKLIIDGAYDFDATYDQLKLFLRERMLPEKWAMEWLDDIQRDILAFAQFIIDHNVTPLAIEMMLCSDRTGLAGAIDLVCHMDIEMDGLDHANPYKSGERKGQPRECKVKNRITAIVDFKSGRKGFWESHELQLHCYKDIVEENYPDLKIDRVFNWSPKDWRSTPTYNLKDQTNSKISKKIPHLLEIHKINFGLRDKSITTISGVLDFKNGLGNCYKEQTMEEYVMSFNEEIKK